MRRINQWFGRVSSEDGQGLIELMIATLVLAVAITALVGILVSTSLSLQRSAIRGTALALADKRLELYRTLSYANIRLDGTAITAMSNTLPYKTANSSDSTIPSATGEVICGGSDGQGNTEPTCASPGPTEVQPRLTGQVGPDGRSYEIDTYITYVSGGSTGRQTKQVTVIVRAEFKNGAIVGRNASTFDSSNVATG